MKKIFIAVGVLAVIAVGFFLAATSGLSEGKDVSLNGISLADVPDGNYAGTYDFKRWTNTVTVQVSAGKITAIDLTKDVAAAGVTDCADEIFRRVIEAQNTTVDAVAGATVTSKAYLKAIENAIP